MCRSHVTHMHESATRTRESHHTCAEINESRHTCDEINESRHTCDEINESRHTCAEINESRHTCAEINESYPVNESCHTYIQASKHPSVHTYQWVMALICIHQSFHTSTRLLMRTRKKISHFVHHSCESCHTHDMSHVTHTWRISSNFSRQTLPVFATVSWWIRQVTHKKVVIHARVWDMSSTDEWVMTHTCKQGTASLVERKQQHQKMSHFTHTHLTHVTHTWTSQVTHLSESCHKLHGRAQTAILVVRTATPDNTLQHCAIFGSTRQHAATRCNTLQHPATLYTNYMVERKRQHWWYDSIKKRRCCNYTPVVPFFFLDEL